MSLNYVRPDEEFFGVLKLTNGEEVLARTIVVEESEGTHVAFVQDPAKVHATETMKDEKRAVAVGLKKWMVFSDEDFFIIPQDRIVTIAPMSHEAMLMYKYFVRTELGGGTDVKAASKAARDLNDSMGFLGKVDQHRKMLEDLFNSDNS